MCCGWDNRGVAIGEGMVFSGQLDANVVALDRRPARWCGRRTIEEWQNGYTITSAPLYYDGIVYTGISGGEYGVRGRLPPGRQDAARTCGASTRVPGPGEFGSDTWPADTDHAMRGGATIWTRRRVDPELGWSTSPPATAARITTARCATGDNLFCASIVALNAKTGEYGWHFQQVHHDIWDYDAPSPVVLFDT